MTILVVLAGQLWFPQRLVWGDEAAYVATAYKIGSQYRLTAAVHVPEDLQRFGRDHKPVHMPAYMIVLALWLKAFSSPRSVLVLNSLFFAAAILLLRPLVRREGGAHPDRVLGLGVLLATPLGVGYANTAMMESFVLLLGTLLFVAWSRLRTRAGGLYAIYGLSGVCFLTRETLALLPLAVVLVDARNIWEQHRRLFRKRRSHLLGIGFVALALGGLGVLALRGRGHYPNFPTRLLEVGSAWDAAGLLADNLQDNLAAFFSWSYFPHDYLYGYTMLLLAACATLMLGRRGNSQRSTTVVVLFWILSLITVCLLYDNFQWRSHRVLGICTLLGTAVLLEWVGSLTSRVRWLLLAVLLSINITLCVAVSRQLVALRPAPRRPHVLTVLKLAEPGDLLFSQDDWQFLIENPRCELMWEVPTDDFQLLKLTDDVKPRFVKVRARQFRPKGYRRLAAYPDLLWVRAAPREG